jgi:hypothetical protein
MKGIAPGKAPTKTARGVLVLSGVYIHTYKKIEIPPKNAVLVLIVYNTNKPRTVNMIAIIKADCTLILPEGKGRF